MDSHLNIYNYWQRAEDKLTELAWMCAIPEKNLGRTFMSEVVNE